MSKYNNFVNTNYSLRTPLVEGEQVIWDAKPRKKAFIINQILPMMPFALLWLAFDSVALFSVFSTQEVPSQILLFLIPFFAIHLFPVWLWLGNIFSSYKRWVNTVYYITDKRIIIQTGFIGIDYTTIYFKDISNVSLKVSAIDKLLGVGDIHFDLKQSSNDARVNSFLDLKNPYEIYPKLQKIVLDIQTDIEYPNALRPDENHGYNTKYTPDEPIKFN